VIQYLKKTNGQLEQLDAAEKNCWINIYPPYSKEEVEKVSTTLDIPIEFLIDSLDIDERSRFESDDGVQLIVVNTPVKNQDDSEYAADYITVPIGIIEVEDYIKIRGNEDQEDFMEDILIDSSQAREMSDVYTNIINTTVDSYASIISNNLNIVLKRLTTITIILMVPTLVASFFGMNVSLPFAESAYAFPITIGLSVLLAVGAFFFFRRQELF